MALFPKCKVHFDPQPYNNPDIFPHNMYRCLHPRQLQHYPMDMETALSSLGTHQRHLDFHAPVKDDLVHILPKGAYADKDNDFCIYLDVSLFSPEELTVKIINDHLIIEGVHEERQAHDLGYVTRNFKRRYELPKGYNPDAIVSKLSSDGVLKVSLPRALNDPKVRIIPIQHSGPSEFYIKNKPVNDDKKVNQDSTEKVEIEDVADAEDSK